MTWSASIARDDLDASFESRCMKRWLSSMCTTVETTSGFRIGPINYNGVGRKHTARKVEDAGYSSNWHWSFDR